MKLSAWLLPVGIMVVVWLFFMWAMVRRSKHSAGSDSLSAPLFNITLSPLLISVVVGVLTAFGPVLDVIKRELHGDGFNGYLMGSGLLMGILTGGVIYAVLSLGVWLIAKAKKKDPSQHF